MATANGSAQRRDGFHLFVYGTLRRAGPAAQIMDGCEHMGEASVAGTLYDVGGRHPALMLYGRDRVQGEVWWCPLDFLQRLDEYEGVERGLFRRVGVRVEQVACWTYVAGPALARELTPDRRIPSGDWLGRQR